jgi:hypothetical protein
MAEADTLARGATSLSDRRVLGPLTTSVADPLEREALVIDRHVRSALDGEVSH